jgi:hypothetical protein
LILTQRLGGALVASPPDMGFRLTTPRGSHPGPSGRSLVVFKASRIGLVRRGVSMSCSLTSRNEGRNLPTARLELQEDGEGRKTGNGRRKSKDLKRSEKIERLETNAEDRRIGSER